MQSIKISFTDLDDLTPGITELYCEAFGKLTYIGRSREGCAVVQKDDSFVCLPELEFNLREFERPFEPETHVRYIKESDLAQLHLDESFLQIELAEKADMVYQYEICMTIRREYNERDNQE